MVTNPAQHAHNLINHIFSSSDGSRRGTIVQLPDQVLHELSAVVTASKPHAGKIHSHYPVLHQHASESFPPGLKVKIDTIVAHALWSMNYNPGRTGVTSQSVSLFSYDHAMQRVHIDAHPSEITREALAADSRIGVEY